MNLKHLLRLPLGERMDVYTRLRAEGKITVDDVARNENMNPPRTKSDREVALSAIEESRRLRSVLERYGRHDDSCSEWPEQNQPCDCGFADAMRAVSA